MADAVALSDGSHLKLYLADAEGAGHSPVEAMVWRAGHLYETLRHNGRVDILFNIERREWKGHVHLQLKAKDLRV